MIASTFPFPGAGAGGASEWEHLHNDGVVAFESGRLGLAEARLCHALEAAEQFGPDDARLGATLHYLGRVYRGQERLAEAEACYRRAMVIREKLGPTDHPDLARTVHNLAVVYCLQGKLAEGGELLARAREMLERSLSPDHPDLGAVRRNLGRLKADRAYARKDR